MAKIAFVNKAIKIHGEKFDYSKFEYKHNQIKSIIICPKHGEFLQTPENHLRSKTGCSKCSLSRRKTGIEIFVKKAREIHGEKYNYDKYIYVNSMTKGIIICYEHGKRP